MAETMPKWLNKELLEKVLKNSERDESIRVIEMSSKAAASKGDNYTSEVLRVIVNFTRKKNSKESSEQRSLIVKVAHIGDGMLKEMVYVSKFNKTLMTLFLVYLMIKFFN